eukprot:1364162-Amorphochlora_amoeboformis.AAC.1
MASHRRLDRLGLSLVAFGDMGYRVGYHRRYTSGRKVHVIFRGNLSNSWGTRKGRREGQEGHV